MHQLSIEPRLTSAESNIVPLDNTDVRLPALETGFVLAFQPIIDCVSREVFAHEALVRGPGGEDAEEVLARVSLPERFAFHEACRVKAIETAAALGMTSRLSLNVMANDAGDGGCFHTAVEAARRSNFPVDRLMFEISEAERAADPSGLTAAFRSFEGHGITSAIDDFGAAYAGFELLAGFQPHVVKIDMGLVRNLHNDAVRLSIVRGFVGTCDELGIQVVAEGVEVADEFHALRALGVRLFQGFLFARPAIEALPPIAWDHAA